MLRRMLKNASQVGAVDKVKFYKNNTPESLKIRLFVL